MTRAMADSPLLAEQNEAPTASTGLAKVLPSFWAPETVQTSCWAAERVQTSCWARETVLTSCGPPETVLTSC